MAPFSSIASVLPKKTRNINRAVHTGVQTLGVPDPNW